MIKDYANRAWVKSTKKSIKRKKEALTALLFWSGVTISFSGVQMAFLKSFYDPFAVYLAVGGSLFAITAPVLAYFIGGGE